jgi:hypothetical protein
MDMKRGLLPFFAVIVKTDDGQTKQAVIFEREDTPLSSVHVVKREFEWCTFFHSLSRV